MKYLFFSFLLLLSFINQRAHAATSSAHDNSLNETLLLFAIFLIAGKIGGVVEKKGQPSVLGELLIGVILSGLAYFGISILNSAKENNILAFLAEFGAVLLLFQIGLESNISKILKVGYRSLCVALIGVVVPFLLGTLVVGPMFFSNTTFTARLFIGAAFVATSVGISAAIFQNLNALETRAYQTVLGAVVIDDILGLLILAIVSAIASGHDVTVGFVLTLSLKAVLFLVLAIFFGSVYAKNISSFFSKIHTGTGMKLGLAITFALAYAYLATLVGLAPIIGAFAAGLVLDAVDFKDFDVPLASFKLQALSRKYKELNEHVEDVIHELNHRHISDMVAGIGLIFIPIFFVYTGLQLDFSILLNVDFYLISFAIAFIAIIGKVVSGVAAQGTFVEKLLVGVSMVPRGEVGLIFASVGRSLGAIDDKLFSIIVLTIIITTLVSPPLINLLFKKLNKNSSNI